MSEKSSKKWTATHSKTYIAMSLCIADGTLNSAETESIKEKCQGWVAQHSDGDLGTIMTAAAQKMQKATQGTDLLDGVNRSASQIAKAAEGSKKVMFAYIKELKAIAEADKDEKPVSESEARIIRLVARRFGFGQKLSVELQDNSIGLIKN